MLQPQPAPSRPHFQPKHQPDIPQDGEIPIVPEGALEQRSLYGRLLANADFLEWLRIQGQLRLQALSSCQDSGRELRKARTLWLFIESMPADMKDYIRGIDATVEARNKAIQAQKSGTAAPETPID